MPRTDLELAQETKRWKEYLLGVDNIPLDANHKYKNEKDAYERLMHHVKSWIEGELGLYTDDSGELRPLDEENQTQESVEMSAAASKALTSLQSNWYIAALKGKQEMKDAIPHYLYGEPDDRSFANTREQLSSTFLPAYRALKESYAKRPFWQWFTNHAQYTAERDAIKVMENFLKSSMHVDKDQLKIMLRTNQNNVTAADVQAATVPPVKMANLAEELQSELQEENIDYRKNIENQMDDLFNAINNRRHDEDEMSRDDDELSHDDSVIENNNDESVNNLDKSEDEIENDLNAEIDESSVNKYLAQLNDTRETIEPSMLFDPNYVPCLSNLENEKILANAWFVKMRQLQEYEISGEIEKKEMRNTPMAKFSQILKRNPEAKEVFRRNLYRVDGAWATKPEEREAYISNHLDEYAKENKALYDKLPDYKAPTIVEGFVTDADIKVVADGIEETKKLNDEPEMSWEEQAMRDYIEEMLIEGNPQLADLKKENPAAFKAMVDDKYTRAVIHDELVDLHPNADEETLNKLVDEEIARRKAEESGVEHIDLSDEFKEDKNVQKSEMVQDVPSVEKKLEI